MSAAESLCDFEASHFGKWMSACVRACVQGSVLDEASRLVVEETAEGAWAH